VHQARNLAMNPGERFEDFRFLIRDRGSNFTRSFDAVFQATGTTILHTAVQAPRMNAICERLAGTLRRELLDRSLILGEAHLRAVLAEYQEHYNTARPHQGIGQRIPDSAHHPPRVITGDFRIRQIRRKPVLSGLINEYEREPLDIRDRAVHGPGSYFERHTVQQEQHPRAQQEVAARVDGLSSLETATGGESRWDARSLAGRWGEH
jgi:hypothetical protein